MMATRSTEMTMAQDGAGATENDGEAPAHGGMVWLIVLAVALAIGLALGYLFPAFTSDAPKDTGTPTPEAAPAKEAAPPAEKTEAAE